MIFKNKSKRLRIHGSWWLHWCRSVWEGLLQLTTEQREECIMKLRYRYPSPHIRLAGLANSTRGLVRQRDEMAQSNAVDPNELEKRLEWDSMRSYSNHSMCADTIIEHRRVERSRSHTPIAPPFDPDDPEQVGGDLRVERQAHQAVINDHGRPCYPIELGFDVFRHPGQYKEILEYWEGEFDAGEDIKRWVS